MEKVDFQVFFQEEWDSDHGTKKWTVQSVNVEQPNSIFADEVEGFKKKKTELKRTWRVC